ncbi:MAG: hypothetical protein Q8O34_00820 [Rhodocyclaceae bacterium]|nr:hypothetical protein [Rhodocyclaceae bacterium]
MNAAPHEKPDWRRLFCRAVAEAGGVLSIVADEMGVSRPLVSLVANGTYHASPGKFGRKVIETYDAFPCPHLSSRVTFAACKGHALRPAPTSSAREARHWRACQTCPHKPAPTLEPNP